MAGGLIALLDDVAALAKLAAASLDDVAGAAGQAGARAAGVVIDDTAVTPRYVAGLPAARELPIVLRIAAGSLRNKLLILLPAALLLSLALPGAITPLLMLGGAYLCFEGAEKVAEALGGGRGHAAEAMPDADPRALEEAQVAGAIRTDLILSAEIMAIALAAIGDRPFAVRAVALALVAVGITAGVYGLVAAIVKMDDAGLWLARRRGRAARTLGRALVTTIPALLRLLSAVGVAAMLWVGGQIVVHGLETFGLTPLPHWIEAAAERVRDGAGAAAGWMAMAALDGVAGLMLGGVFVGAVHLLPRRG